MKLRFERISTGEIVEHEHCKLVIERDQFGTWYSVWDNSQTVQLSDGCYTKEEAIDNAVFIGRPDNWNETDIVYHGWVK